MKCNVLIVLVIILLNPAYGQQFAKKYTISGRITGIGDSKVLLANKGISLTQATKTIYYDSCTSQKDSFYFQGNILEPSFYSIEIPSNYKGWRFFINDGSDIKIFGHVDSIHLSKVFGSKEHDSFQDYRINYYRSNAIILNNFVEKQINFEKIFDTINSKIYLDSAQIMGKLITSTALKYIKDNSNSFVSIFLLNDLLNKKVSIKLIKKYYKYLSDEIKQHSTAKLLNIFIGNSLKKGSNVSNIYVPDLNEKNTSLLNPKSKYTIINFWASWCAPCIKELPQLDSLYTKYKRDKLEIIGISLDVDRSKMVNSIQKHGIKWNNLSDFNGHESRVCKMFLINSIPRLYLINRRGKILLFDVNINQLTMHLNKLIDLF